MIWEIHQQAKIHKAEDNARKASNKVDQFDTEIRDLRRHLDRLSLASQSMWELLREHSELTEEDLEAKILEVDGRDGIVDGKISRQITVCGNCGKNTNTRRTICIMCGAPVDRPHKFEG